jgi:hypothetical protein
VCGHLNIEGGGGVLGEGHHVFDPAPLLFRVPPVTGGSRFRWAFPVSCFGSPASVAVAAFGLESVCFVAVYYVPCVPADNVVGA